VDARDGFDESAFSVSHVADSAFEALDLASEQKGVPMLMVACLLITSGERGVSLLTSSSSRFCSLSPEGFFAISVRQERESIIYLIAGIASLWLVNTQKASGDELRVQRTCTKGCLSTVMQLRMCLLVEWKPIDSLWIVRLNELSHTPVRSLDMDLSRLLSVREKRLYDRRSCQKSPATQ